MIQFIYLVPLFPLLGFLINGWGWRSIPKSLGGIIGSTSVLASFIVSLLIFFEVKQGASEVVTLFDFINSGRLQIPFAFQVDALSSLFLLIITGIGFLIHVYSASYMHEDEGMVKYFAYLNLFVFSMLLLVLGANYLIMFIGWEGVGLCSYLLIGFWYKNKDFAKAGKKAFVMNR
nr:proton-conducting transporter membrane subunit [Flavipsychrobacter sp.]